MGALLALRGEITSVRAAAPAEHAQCVANRAMEASGLVIGQ
jgi:hypothetical protein